MTYLATAIEKLRNAPITPAHLTKEEAAALLLAVGKRANGDKPTTRAERDAAENVLRRMAREMEVRFLEITVWPVTDSVDVEIGTDSYFYTDLDAAYIAHMHKRVGTTPPPF